jgi:hypothetical protein
MSIMAGKGSSFNIDVGAGLAAVSQVIGITPPEGANETFEADYLGNASAGIPHQATGRTEGGSASAEVWLDNTSHAGLIGLLATPDTNGFSCSIGFTSGTWTFTGAGLTFGGGSVALSDGVKANLAVKLSGVAAIGAGT